MHRERLGCSWRAHVDGACLSCSLTHLIPDLDPPQNVARLARLEAAKRLALLSHLRLGLRWPTRRARTDGLAFEFVDDVVLPDGSVKVALTGHQAGTIRVAVAEADEVERIERKVAMRERFRTLVGHFRHELGHFFWDRVVRDAGQFDRFRACFGDEREDYGAALARFHAEGAPSDWPTRFVSRYATYDDPYALRSADDLVASWVPLALATNGLGRSLGQADLYPFVLTPAVVAKMQLVLDLVAHAHASAPARVA
jgi:hypothetical protein